MTTTYSLASARIVSTLLLFAAVALAPARSEGMPKFLSSAVATAVPASAGSKAEVIVKLSIPSGYHIQANPASKDMVATEITATGPHGFVIGKPIYPKGLVRTFGGESVLVYEGAASMHVPVTIPKNEAPGKYSVKIGIQVQGCDDKACYPPVQITTSATLTIVPSNVRTKAPK